MLALLDDAVTAETKRLADWTKRFHANIESESDNPLETAVVEVEAVLGEVARLGKGASSDARLAAPSRELRQVDTGVLSELLAFYGDDATPEPFQWRLASAARDWSSVTQPVTALIDEAGTYFNALEEVLDGGAGGELDTGLLRKRVSR